jgi:hypothetical protein
MENITDHANEPARFPCIETERAIARATGLIKQLKKQLPEIWQRDIAKDILGELTTARDGFKQTLQNNQQQRMRLIELASSPEVV